MEEKTFQTNIQFSGKNAIVGIVVLIAFVGIRIISLGETDDQALKEAFIVELRNELGGEMMRSMSEIEEGDYDSYLELADQTDMRKIEIHSLSVSEPILSFSSDSMAVVKIEFTLPNSSRQKAYYYVRHRTFNSWEIRRETTAAAFYLNFF